MTTTVMKKKDLIILLIQNLHHKTMWLYVQYPSAFATYYNSTTNGELQSGCFLTVPLLPIAASTSLFFFVFFLFFTHELFVGLCEKVSV
jgi:hypothetical protein